MGYTQVEVEKREKEERERLLDTFLAKHELTLEDVKRIGDDSDYAIAMIEGEDFIEQFILYKRVDVSDKFRVTVDYNLEVDEKPKVRKEKDEKK